MQYLVNVPNWVFEVGQTVVDSGNRSVGGE
jgi:hypothetical protein